MTIYQKLKDANVPLDHHESDLYALVTRESVRIVMAEPMNGNIRTFTSQKDGHLWYDIPFAYEPFWDGVRERSR